MAFGFLAFGFLAIWLFGFGLGLGLGFSFDFGFWRLAFGFWLGLRISNSKLPACHVFDWRLEIESGVLMTEESESECRPFPYLFIFLSPLTKESFYLCSGLRIP